MGYFGKIDLQTKAIELRKKGFSIRNIEKILEVSRASASSWVKDVKLTQPQIDALYKSKKDGGLKGSYKASQNKIQKRLIHTKNIEASARRDIAVLSKRDRFMLGIALYFGEGSKTSHNVSFTNSVAQVMRFMKDWLIEFCKIEANSIRCNVFIHDNLNEKSAKRYWKEMLDLEETQFKKSYIVKNNPNRFRKTKHTYGICRITVSRIDTLRQILGWIKAVFYV